MKDRSQSRTPGALALLGFLGLWVFAGFGFTGCASNDSKVSEGTGKPGGESVLTGTVAYRERMALPADAEVYVWLRDVSPGMQIQAITAETTVQAAGRQVPIPFELRYDPARIQADHDYAVKATIQSAGGEALFASTNDQLVITKGNPTKVSLMLARSTAESGGSGGNASGLVGTSWRLEDLGGAGVLDNVEATLEFPEAGRVAGRGSCNQFTGSVEVTGQSIKFGNPVATLMACAEAVSNQEKKYFAALRNAERYERDGTALLIYSKGMEKPLRFMPKEK